MVTGVSKAILVLCVSVLAYGLVGDLVAVASPLSGVWSLSSQITLSSTQAVILSDFAAMFNLDYTIDDWKLGARSRFTEDLFQFIYLQADGKLGDIDVHSGIFYRPDTAAFRSWISLVRVSIAGVDLYGILSVRNFDHLGVGSGLVLGCWGSFWNISVWLQTQFNATASNWTIHRYGYDWLVEHQFYELCQRWFIHRYSYPQTATCSLAWEGADIVIKMPFAGFDLTSHARFSSERGFDYLYAEAGDLCWGVSWLKLAQMSVTFTTETKSVGTAFSLAVGEYLFFTPYLALDVTGTSINGIALHAIIFDYDMDQGISFKAGHRFSEGYYWWTWDEALDSAVCLHAFTADGDVTVYSHCVYNQEYDGYFAIMIDGEACCGGLLNASMYNWFDSSQTEAFMDWAETVGNLEVGIGVNATLKLIFSFTGDGFSWFKVGFDYNF